MPSVGTPGPQPCMVSTHSWAVGCRLSGCSVWVAVRFRVVVWLPRLWARLTESVGRTGLAAGSHDEPRRLRSASPQAAGHWRRG